MNNRFDRDRRRALRVMLWTAAVAVLSLLVMHWSACESGVCVTEDVVLDGGEP